MTTANGHTAIPWRLQNVMSAKNELVGFTVWEDGAADFPIAGITLPPANLSMMQDEAKANAAFIVRAVNSFEAMREALSKTLTCASLNSDVRALVEGALAEARKGGE